MKYKTKPTHKQLAALEIMKANPKMPKGEAMIRAGYSPKTALAPGANLLETPGVEAALKDYQTELAGLGLTHRKVAEKIQQFVDAKKPFTSHTEPDTLIDDWQTQIKGVEMLRNDLGLSKLEQANTNIQIVFTRGEDETS